MALYLCIYSEDATRVFEHRKNIFCKHTNYILRRNYTRAKKRPIEQTNVYSVLKKYIYVFAMINMNMQQLPLSFSFSLCPLTVCAPCACSLQHPRSKCLSLSLNLPSPCALNFTCALAQAECATKINQSDTEGGLSSDWLPRLQLDRLHPGNIMINRQRGKGGSIMTIG